MKIAINTIGQTGQWFYLMRRNQLWVGIKIMPKVLLYKYLPSILIYNIASLPYHAIRGRGRLINEGILRCKARIVEYAERRQQIQSARNLGAGYPSREIHIRGYLSLKHKRDFSMFSTLVVADLMASRLR